LKSIASRLGLDLAVSVTLLRWGWNVGGGLLTIIVITYFLSAELQGYYYTFNSLIALQVFAEMGLNFAIIQFASHEMPQLTWQPSGTLSGQLRAKRRLQSLMFFAFSWFGLAAILMIVVLIPLGLYFFDEVRSSGDAMGSVALPWLLLVLFTAMNLFISAAVAILEGCGKVADMSMLRLVQAVFAMSSAWLVLSVGGGVYALAISSMMMLLVGLIWLWFKYRLFFNDLRSHVENAPGLDWRKEIWPFQWRIAVSFMSGYLISQLFVPLVFKTHGAVAAGQMGMSLQIIGALNGAAMAWIVTKAPTYGRLVAANQRKELDRLFVRGLIQSAVFLFIAISVVLSMLYFLQANTSPYIGRVLPFKLFALLCVVSLSNHFIYAEAAYLRAHKQEPFMLISVFIGLLSAVLAVLLVPPLGSAGAVYAYASATLSIGLLGGTFVFFTKRKQWMRERNAFADYESNRDRMT